MDTHASTANPANIAREAIRRLAATRVAPTPENFEQAYLEASGTGESASVVKPEHVLHKLVQGITSRSPELIGAQQLQEHVKRRSWNNALKAVGQVLSEAMTGPSREWPRILQQVLSQLDATHTDWTRARKLSALNHVLMTPSADERTREKLERLMAGWKLKTTEHTDPPVSEASAADCNSGESALVAANADAVLPAADPSAEVKAWRLLALTALDLYQPSQINPDPDHTRKQNTAVSHADSANNLSARLAKFAGVPGAEWLHEVQSASAATLAELRRQGALRDRLVKLLRLVCENLTLFADDDAWVNGQVARITQLLDAPLDERVLTEAEDSLRLAVQRQSELKAELGVAKAAIKDMLSSLIDHLAIAATSTGECYRRISERAESIKQADDLPSLSRVVASLLDDAVEMREGIKRTHGELSSARESATRYEARVQALEQELVDVSSLMRIDPLTQVLNRRGLAEAFAIEQARAEREGGSLAVALLDIDNFKGLNDSYGHQTGDIALIHVADMVRGALRPSDTVARYGGEEFVILLPDTSAAEAVNILTRAQRQLTRAFFLHNDKKILITFSAGIADYRAGDSHESVIQRADDAVYAAKAAGKNRVQIAGASK